MRSNIYAILSLLFLISSCGKQAQEQKNESKNSENKRLSQTILEKVDDLDQQIKQSTKQYKWAISLDHHRMAEEEGAYTPPAIATIFSDAAINTKLLAQGNQLIGLDLPFKVLSYSEADTTTAKLAFTSAEFIAKRHDISLDDLAEFKLKMDGVLNSVDKSYRTETNVDSVSKGFGIINLRSDFDFETTVEKLIAIVNAQSDTRWFGDIDYQLEAKALGTELNPTKILFFGGPAPGAKAMRSTPKIGLDAFCQKLLVYENEKGETWVGFNDIADFSKLYYGKSTKPQEVINKRLVATFSKAIKKETE